MRKAQGIDHWSVGVLLHELLTGSTPFEGSTPSEMLAAIEEQRGGAEGVPQAARSLMDGLLTVDPQLRLGVRGSISDGSLLGAGAEAVDNRAGLSERFGG